MDQFGAAITPELQWRVSGGGTIQNDGTFTSDGSNGSILVIVTPKDMPAVADTAVVNMYAFEPMLNYSYYRSIMTTVAKMGELTPTKNGTVHNFDISVRTDDNDFGLRYTGYIKILVEGDYEFTANSDDGMVCYVDGHQIINFDGPHDINPQRIGGIHLTKGMHSVRVDYYQGGGDRGLNLQWKSEGFTLQPIPDSLLFHLPEGVTLTAPVIRGAMNVTAYSLTVRNGAHGSLVRFAIPAGVNSSRVSLQLFDLRGRLVRTLVKGEAVSGVHTISLAPGKLGQRLSAGLYLCRMTAPGFGKTAEVILR
jgi:hypothetical protein